MKVNLNLVSDGMQIEIHSENDVESIALEAWADKYFNNKEGAFLVISRNAIAPNNACTRPASAVGTDSESDKSAGG